MTIVPHGRGVRLLCNRDERRSRPLALPPRIHELGGCRAAFPVDPQGGGTWIGVNGAGLAVALLNVRRAASVATSQSSRSRGLIVRELLSRATLGCAIETLKRLDARAFEPFKVVVVHDRRVAVATSDEAALVRCREGSLDRPLLFTSSSLGDDVVAAPRKRLFERLVVRNATGWLEGQMHFHAHHWPHRPEISVCMVRRDALTVSRTRIDVTNGSQQLLYEAPVYPAIPNRVREWCSLH